MRHEELHESGEFLALKTPPVSFAEIRQFGR
jgi:hypothetical protein